MNALTVLLYSYYRKRLITWEQIKAYAKSIGSPGGRDALLQVAKQAVPDNFEELTSQYPSINVPTLIVWGREDRVIPLSIGEMLDDDIPDSRLVLLEQAGHVPQEEKPEETIEAIAKFLKRPVRRRCRTASGSERMQGATLTKKTLGWLVDCRHPLATARGSATEGTCGAASVRAAGYDSKAKTGLRRLLFQLAAIAGNFLRLLIG